MRSLKECYEITKKYHAYWTGNPKDERFMCLAACEACRYRDLTYEEFVMLRNDIKSLLCAINPFAISLITALDDPTDVEVKAYWDKYIDNLENHDG